VTAAFWHTTADNKGTLTLFFQLAFVLLDKAKQSECPFLIPLLASAPR